MPPEKMTDFGFERVSHQEKENRVRNVFQRVASRYDIMNDVMSAGLHRHWKETFVQSLPFSKKNPPVHILDMASGTGDIAARILRRRARLEIERSNTHLTLCDLTEEMLHQGKKNLSLLFPEASVGWVCGNAESIPLPQESVDLYTISFGLRNVASPERALTEACRVLRPGGSFFCLEFSHVTSPLLSGLYDAYSFFLIPKLGAWIANDKEAYQYLVESIRKFPSQKILLQMMEEGGFARAGYQNLWGGVVAIYWGQKQN